MRDPDFLYDFLPRFNRRKDMEQGSPLRALFTILQAQYDLIEGDIAALYDNWFAETCENWVLPYIADLIGGTGFQRLDRPGMDGRRLVANTLAYRRRKGLPATLEQVIEDATGWPARVVEFSRRLTVTQTVRRPRLAEGRLADLRDRNGVSRLDDPFDRSARTAAIRPNAGYAPDRVGIVVWRLRSYPLRQVAARPSGDGGRYCVHPLGRDMPLFQRHGLRRGIEERLTENDVPARLTPATGITLGERMTPSVSVWLQDADVVPQPVSPDDIAIADLGAWTRPEGLSGHPRVAIDPGRGRLLLLHPEDHHKTVFTDHCYGFAADLGGGPYARPQPPQSALPSPDWRAHVVAGPAAGPTTAFAHLDEAFDAWAKQDGDGVIEIGDSRTYAPSASAKDWSIGFAGARTRMLTLRGGAGERPCLLGGITVTAGPAGATLVLDGLLIGGTIHLRGRVTLILNHCSVFPGGRHPAISATAKAAADLRVILAGTLCGPIRLPRNASTLAIADSIVDGGDLEAIGGPPPRGGETAVDHAERGAGPPTEIKRSTLNGEVMVESITATDTIFIDRLIAVNRQEGTVGHCWLPASSQTPQRLHCLSEAAAPSLPDTPPSRPNGMRRAGEPVFASTTFGEPGYFRLAAAAPADIRQSAADGGEMGAYHGLGDGQRAHSLQEALAEYLPYGLEPIIIFST